MGTLRRKGSWNKAVRDLVRRSGLVPNSRAGRKLAKAIELFYAALPLDSGVELAVTVEHSPDCTMAAGPCFCDPQISVTNANEPQTVH